MALLRDDPEFAVAIGRAAQALGDLDPSFVEKDYWVTQVLRALQTEYPGAFLFKGGTSLSKGYGIIERFSEDVDILVVPLAGASIREGEAHLRAIAGAVAGHLELESEEGRAPGRGREASRGDLLKYEPVVEGGIRVGIGPGSILLETGYSGGHEPAEMVSIEPIMCDPLEIDPEEHEDTQPFLLRALEPRRTLIEKLFALHHVATLFGAGDVRDRERFGRHYYDIYKLLEHAPTMTKLTRDRDRFAELVEDVERLSRLHFGAVTPRPERGFASSPAFAPDSPELREWLEAKFNEVLDLLPREANRPTFGRVLQRVEQQSELL